MSRRSESTYVSSFVDETPSQPHQHYSSPLFSSPLALLERSQADPKPEDIHVHRERGEIKSESLPRWKRRELFPELYRRVDMTKLARGPAIPRHVQQWFLEVFAEPLEHGAQIRLGWDPHIRRWALFQRLGGFWEECWIGMKQIPDQDYLPPDLNTRYHKHLRGKIGDYAEPTKKDFIIIRDLWLRENTPEMIDNKIAVTEDAREADAERILCEQEEDLLRYYHKFVWRAANHGRRGYSLPSVEYRPDGARWRVEDMNGWKVRVRRGSEEEKKLQALLDERERLGAALFDAKMEERASEARRRKMLAHAKQVSAGSDPALRRRM